MRLGAAFVLVVLLGVVTRADGPPATQPTTAATDPGDEMLWQPPIIKLEPDTAAVAAARIVARADSVEALRIFPMSEWEVESCRAQLARKNLDEKLASVLEKWLKAYPTDLSKGTVGDYRIVAEGATQGKEFAGEWSSILGDDGSYFRETPDGGIVGVPGCFEPGVAFRCRSGKSMVYVLVCFRCHVVRIGVDDGGQAQTHDISLSAIGYDRFLKLAKQAFPDDAEIQAIKPLEEGAATQPTAAPDSNR